MIRKSNPKGPMLGIHINGNERVISTPSFQTKGFPRSLVQSKIQGTQKVDPGLLKLFRECEGTQNDGEFGGENKNLLKQKIANGVYVVSIFGPL